MGERLSDTTSLSSQRGTLARSHEIISRLRSDAGYVARIVAFTQRQSQALKLCPINEPLAKGDLLGAGNSNSLAPFERRYELASVQKTVRGSSVQPSEAPAHTFDRQLPAVEIDGGSNR